MEEQFREQLIDGEELLWTGRPEAFETLDKTNKTSFYIGAVVKVLITICIALVFVYSSLQNGTGIPVVGILVILALGAFSIASPILAARRLRNKTVYGLTNKRIMRLGPNSGIVPYDRIQTAALRTDDDGHTTLLCGPRACRLKPSKWRGEADVGYVNSPDEPEADRVILYAIPMDNKLKEIIKKYLPVK